MKELIYTNEQLRDILAQYAEYQYNSEFGAPKPNLPAGVALLESRRAVRGTAAAYAECDRLLNHPRRCAPVQRVFAGHIATSEAVRYVTLIRKK